MPSPATIIIGILLVAMVALIVRHVHRQAKRGGCAACPGGGCGGSCAACSGAAAEPDGSRHRRR